MLSSVALHAVCGKLLILRSVCDDNLRFDPSFRLSVYQGRSLLGCDLWGNLIGVSRKEVIFRLHALPLLRIGFLDLLYGGAVVLQKNIGKGMSLRFLIRALCVWFLSAFLLLSLSSFFLMKSDIGSHVLGYVSSGISFLAAFLSSRFLSRVQKETALLSSLLFGLILVIILLTLGFLVGERSPDPSGVLSVVSFSFAGVLLGNLLPHLPIKTRRNRRSFVFPR